MKTKFIIHLYNNVKWKMQYNFQYLQFLIVNSKIFYQIQIFKPRADSLSHIHALRMAIRARVQGSMKSAANLLNAALQLLTLKEGHESGLVNFVSLSE